MILQIVEGPHLLYVGGGKNDAGQHHHTVGISVVDIDQPRENWEAKRRDINISTLKNERTQYIDRLDMLPSDYDKMLEELQELHDKLNPVIVVKYYDNGKVITKDRMEDEPWYPEYQEFMEMAIGEVDPDILFKKVLKKWKEEHSFKNRDLYHPGGDRIDDWNKWCAMHTSLNREFLEDKENQDMALKQDPASFAKSLIDLVEYYKKRQYRYPR